MFIVADLVSLSTQLILLYNEYLKKASNYFESSDYDLCTRHLLLCFSFFHFNLKRIIPSKPHIQFCHHQAEQR